jgi:predicted transglutaminase-like cysteine proteinase
MAGAALALGLACAGAAAARAEKMSLAEIGRGVKAEGSRLFGSLEFRSPSLSALPQWRRILEKMQSDRDMLARCTADAKDCRPASARAWREAIAQARGLGRRQQIDIVNRYFNKWPYKLDSELYGVREYWATPVEFMSRSGDCEDFAIAKFFALRQLGFGNEEMRVVALLDQIRGIGHAVLVIFLEGDILVLDNLNEYVLSHNLYAHYRPHFSVNETHRWAHVRAVEPALAGRERSN